ncbi:MAG TPA: AAA family ATPase [Rhabdochlamydiaceae bacterium]|nr:AAA family ATPase [Rhabdochlamydiaceae bacterium]
MSAQYPKNLETWKFDEKRPQNSDLERVTIAREQGASEDQNFEVKSTQSKTNFRSSLGMLDQMIQKDQVPNVILLTGPKNVANVAFAKEFAKKLMGSEHASKIDSGHHPDLHIYEIEGKSGTHTVLSIHHFIKEVFLPPFEAKVKVFIIDDAHRMLPASGNSLLKTLEEPTLDSIILLISDRPELLLPTIVSRCRKVPLSSSLGISDEFNLAAVLEAVKEKDYVQLFKELAQIEEIILKEEVGTALYFQKIEELFQSILRCTGSLKALKLIETCRLAIERNLKLRTVLLNFFLSINPS